MPSRPGEDPPAIEAPGHPEIVRIVAPNPGPMTLSGTNTYVVGSTPAWVIDPGPADPGHIEEVRDVAEARGGIGGVVLTHSHSDHTGGVEMLGGELTWGDASGRDEAAELGEALRAWRAVRVRGASSTRRKGSGSPESGPASSRGASAKSGRFGCCRRRGTPATTSPSCSGRSASAATSCSARDRRSCRPPRAAARSSTTCARSTPSRRSGRSCSVPATGPGSPTRRRRSPSTPSTGASASGSCSMRSTRARRSEGDLLDAAWSDVPGSMRPAAALAMRAHLEKLADEGRLPEGFEPR